MFVDPKITLSGDRKHAVTLIRAARVYLDTQLHQDAAYNRQVSKTKKLLPNGAYIEATHEFGQTYLHIHVPESSSKRTSVSKKPQTTGKMYGSSGLYLWGIAPDGSYREYLVSHTAPYVFLVGLVSQAGLSVTTDPRVYSYPANPSVVLAPFSTALQLTKNTFTYSRLCSWLTKQAVYLGTPYQVSTRGGVDYRLCGYVPFLYQLACSVSAYALPPIPFTQADLSLQQASESPTGFHWGAWNPEPNTLLWNIASDYFNNPLALDACVFFAGSGAEGIQTPTFVSGNFSEYIPASGSFERYPDSNTQVGVGNTAWIPPFGSVVPPYPLSEPYNITYQLSGVAPVADGTGNVHGVGAAWTSVITNYSDYPAASGAISTLATPKSMAITATALFYGGNPNSLDVESALNFYTAITWPAPIDNLTFMNASNAAWWGDLFQTNWQYGELDSGKLQVHCISCKVTAEEPTQDSTGAYEASFQNFNSTITDYYTGKSTTVDGFVLWPLTTNSKDFITVAITPQSTSYIEQSALFPGPPNFAGYSCVYQFRGWSSPPVVPGSGIYPIGTPLANNTSFPEWLWDGCPACADTSPMGEVFFAASDLSYVVHEPNPALPFPLPVLGSSKDPTNTQYDFDLTQLFTTLLACIWL